MNDNRVAGYREEHVHLVWEMTGEAARKHEADLRVIMKANPEPLERLLLSEDSRPDVGVYDFFINYYSIVQQFEALIRVMESGDATSPVMKVDNHDRSLIFALANRLEQLHLQVTGKPLESP